jgi:undecaprenyl-diphosphatase
MQRILTFDGYLLFAVRRWHLPALTRLARALTHLGDAQSWTFAVLLLACSGGAGVLLATRLGLAVVVATGVVQVLKRRLRRPRPSRTLAGFTALADDPDAFSFPSGHSAAAVAAAIALAGAGTALGPFLVVLAVGISASRVYLGAHYPLDVAAGVLIGSLSGWVALLALGV